jgi:hypothetical protein
MNTFSTRIKPIILILMSSFFLISLLHVQVLGQEKAKQQQKKKQLPPAKNYTVSETHKKIKIDGKLEEPAWQEATIIPLPYEWFPGNNTPARTRTQCLLTYDRTGLYIAFRCFDPEPKKIRAHLMDRDAVAFLREDHVTILIDSYNDERRAFEFRVNPLGVQMDGTYNELTGRDDFSWDAIWKSAGKITDSGYILEIRIPFNQLRFPKSKKKQTWGFSFYRFYPREYPYRMSSHPVDWDSNCSLCQSHKIAGLANISPGRSIEFDPTLTLNRTDQRSDFPSGEIETGKMKSEFGITARWGVTSNVTLNAAVNPDFSHVEADVAQLEVNTRFALYYPEKRPFFLEGKDYFQTPLEAVFTRTVFDPAWGAKVTGKAGKNVFGLFTANDRYNNLLFPSNQGSRTTSIDEAVFGGVFRFRRDVGKGSTLGILYTGRTGSDYYNHTAGVDGFIRLSRSNSLGFQYLGSQTRYPEEIARDFNQDTDSFGGGALSLKVLHLSRKLNYSVEYKNISSNFRADYGFIPRVDLKSIGGFIEPVFWGKPGGWFNQISLLLSGEEIKDRQGHLTDRSLGFSLTYLGPLQTRFIPSFHLQKEFYEGVTYDKTLAGAFFDIRPASGLLFYISTNVGDSIDYSNSRLADRFFLDTGIDVTLGKHLNINITNIYEQLSLKGSKIYSAHLLQTRFVYNFSVRTFVRAIIQYTDINRNTHLYTFPIESETKRLFTQFLFSYTINPQTVLFLGYSDNRLGNRGIDITQTDRTFFLKIGYALVL